MTCHRFLAALVLASCGIPALPAAEAPDDSANDGTDPTRPPRLAAFSYEHLDLGEGYANDTFFATVQTPFGAPGQTLKLRVPLAANDSRGSEGFSLGDVAVKYTRVMERNPVYGVVLSGEMFFNTATRDELGSGRDVFKATAIYARFIGGGRIFAPALLHAASVGGDSDRGRVSNTTLDLYFVPKLANPKLYMTLDPFVSRDWEHETQYTGLAVTLGYRLGPVWRGRGQVFIKPQVLAGGDRPADWGLELGFQLLGW